jgi:hypothetical protein
MEAVHVSSSGNPVLRDGKKKEFHSPDLDDARQRQDHDQ